MANTNEKKFLYNDVNERYIRMNRFYIISTVIMWVLFLLYIWLKLGVGAIAPITVYGNTVLLLAFLVTDILMYIKNKTGKKLSMAVLIQTGLEVFLIGAQSDAEFIFFCMIIILAMQIPFYEVKPLKRAAFGYGIVYTIVMIARVMKQMVELNVDYLLKMLCLYLLLFVVYKIGSIVKLFSDHALGSVEEQNGKQREMFDGIVEISKVVSDKANESVSLIDRLVGTTETVASSMQEITAATNTTALSIEEQNNMTQSIQEAIEQTGARSKEMVAIATDSNASIQQNIEAMNELKEQAVLIARTNHDVTEAMTRLQAKTKEVEEFTAIILNISSQTNMLALNASIESARAGEAGRGFAVVADQIRQLAEQTRKSTEEITRIVQELNVNANEVVGSIGDSVEATEYQSHKIQEAADAFENLNTNMATLIDDIKEIDNRISGLYESNNKIVENITHLSAATEQVTASAEQVQQMSESNLAFAEQVKFAIDTIEGTSEDLKQYL